MNSEPWRIALYPLGYVALAAFMLRFAVQWFYSEYKQKSLVPRLFWQISLVGNILLAIHALIQVQSSTCVVQACNIVISWRNLNLMDDPEKRASFTTVLVLLATSIASTFAGFILQGMVFFGEVVWARTPVTGWSDPDQSVSFFLHLTGALGIILFSGRFWIQWWYAEKSQESTLDRTFWWLSISGAILTIIYFVILGDIVNVIGPTLGLIPYVRNLFLIKKEKEPRAARN